MKQIPLNTIRKGKNFNKLFALVDDEDFELVKDINWSFHKGYIINRANYKKIYLHRLIMDCPKDKIIDHINLNTLDNRKSNLRICNQGENSRNTNKYRNNTSGFKGVTWEKLRNKWSAEITFKYKHFHIGRFDTALHAAMAYDIAAKDLHGKFAKLNFKVL
jgi:hypothetical protein